MNGFTGVARLQSMRVHGVVPSWQKFNLELKTNPVGHSYSFDSPFSQTRDLRQSLGSINEGKLKFSRNIHNFWKFLPGKIPSSVHANEGPLGQDGLATDVQAPPTQY